ncbi:unnamed protein product [Symbiodinium sp. KB8]|nr:unnamed protein product [Symbiodinium sp. KB8]
MASASMVLVVVLLGWWHHGVLADSGVAQRLGMEAQEVASQSLLQLSRSGALSRRLAQLSSDLAQAAEIHSELGNGTSKSLEALQEELEVLRSHAILVDVAAVEKLRSGVAQCNADLEGAFQGKRGVNSLEAAAQQAEGRHDACRTTATEPESEGKSYYNGYGPGRQQRFWRRRWRFGWRRRKRRWGYGSLVESEASREDETSSWKRRRRTSCDDLQHELESAFCQYRARLTETCGELEACSLRLGQRLADGADEALLEKAEVWRTRVLNAEAAAQCFLESFSSSTDPSGCENVVANTSNLDLPFPGLAACDTSAVATFPCQEEWMQQYYTRKPWYGPSATLAACRACQI